MPSVRNRGRRREAGPAAQRGAPEGRPDQSSTWVTLCLTAQLRHKKSGEPRTARRNNHITRCHCLAEAEGLEPPCACARRISSAVPYQLGLRLPSSISIGAPGFEPGTSASRTQRSTELSHAPFLPTIDNGRGGIRTHAGLHPHDFQSCALSHSATRPGHTRRPLGPDLRVANGGSGIRTHVGFLSPAP